jgi:HTH-type transcriptional regulator, sugar sensing transcriptional regulator
MIVQKEFLSKLKDFGLNSYESKLWTALLSRGVSTAGELSDIANVPRSRTYDVLESLERKGFIIMKLGKPIKYLAVPPSEVVERVKKKVLEDSSKQVSQLDKIKDSEVLEELNLLHSQGVELVEPTDIAASIKGRNNLYNHIELMLSGAEKSVTIVTSTSGFLRKVEIMKNTLKKLKDRGVKVRIAAPMTKETEAAAKDLKGIVEIKHSDVNARFVLVDGKELVFMLLDDKDVHPTYDVGIWVNTPFFASALEDLFEVAWKNMEKVEAKTK